MLDWILNMSLMSEPKLKLALGTKYNKRSMITSIKFHYDAHFNFRFLKDLEPSGGQILVECDRIHCISYFVTLYLNKLKTNSSVLKSVRKCTFVWIIYKTK